MAEVQQEQQPVEPQVPLDTSEDALLGRAMGLEDPAAPRDEKGRFVSQKPAEQPQDVPQEQQKPAQTEDPADKPAEQADPATTEQEAVKWDEVKDVKIKVPMKNGDKEWEDEVTLEQMRNERMMHSDYMARRREMDEQAKTYESKASDAVANERQQYFASLETLKQSIIQAAAPELVNVDWNKLAQENPAEYVRLSNRAREFTQAIERVNFEQEKTRAQQEKDQKDRLSKLVTESKAKLRDKIPGYGEELEGKLFKRGTDTYGFAPEEIGAVWDHRVIEVLHDAHQWRAMQEGKPLAEKKVQTVPSVLRPGSAKPKVDPQAQKFQQAKARLAANGNDGDAAEAVLAAFITPKGR